MPSFAQPKPLDEVAWRWATVSAPFVVQGILGLLFVNMWLLGKWPFRTYSEYGGERAWMLTAISIAAVVSFGLSGVLLSSSSSRKRGLALSTAASSTVVLVGGVIFACLMFR